MQIHWKIFGKALLAGAWVALMATGCGGFSGSHSVSPASFLLPGLLKNEPPPPAEAPAPQLELTNWVAQLK
jgi:hypothetical protein